MARQPQVAGSVDWALSWRFDSEALPSRPMIIEIRAAEGGDDAKLLVIEQWRVYKRAIELERL